MQQLTNALFIFVGVALSLFFYLSTTTKTELLPALITKEEKTVSSSSITSSQQQQQQQQQQQLQPKSKLFPFPLDLYRQHKSYPLNITTTTITPVTTNKTCSCDNNMNATASATKCCRRYLHTMHKMGYMLSLQQELGFQDYYKSQQIIRSTLWHKLSFNKRWTSNPPYHELDFTLYRDFRDVFLFRNIYDSIVSGYLYHKSGRECWLTMQGEPIGRDKLQNQKWNQRLSYDLNTSDSRGQPRSFCKYMADESFEKGMRAYIDLVFRYNYRDGLARWSILEHHYLNNNNIIPAAKKNKHLHIACFEDLMSSDHRRDTEIQKLHNFFFGIAAKDGGGDNNNIADTVSNNNNTVIKYKGGHTTSDSHNTALKEHLINVIKQIDTKYYNNDIEWLSSIWPCWN